MERKTVIEVNHVHKKFKNAEVLKGVTLRCESGKIYGLVGYNGSGKTVLLKCICGFLNYEEGEIRINEKKLGRELAMLPSAGIIIEEPSFLRRWDAYHNLKFLYTICNQNDKAHLCQVLRLVGLDPGSRKPVGKYSLGMKQRLAIAQAVMEDPDVLILDEPMNGLDKNGIQQMRELFLDLKRKGKLILLASHNKEDIDVLCDEVYEMENGRMERIR